MSKMPPTKYLDFYISEGTKETYTYAILRYLEIVAQKKIEVKNLDAEWENYLSGDQEPIKDLIIFPKLARSAKLAPTTSKLYMHIAEQYLKEIHDIKLTEQEIKMRRRSEPKYHAVSKRVQLDRITIAQILKFSSLRTRVEILFAVSGGLRIGEILSLEFEDIDVEAKPAKIRIRSECSKNQIERTVHISSEAVDEYLAYLRIRDEDINRGVSGADAEKKKESKKIIPFSYVGESVILTKTLKRAGLYNFDEKGKRSEIHFHTFRAYFSTKAHKSTATSVFVEYLMGHTGYLTDAYWQPTEEDRKQMYAKIEPHILINIPPDYEELKIETSEKITDLQQTNSHLMAELMIMRSLIDNMQKEQERQSTMTMIGGLPRRLPHDDPDISDV
ncbi:site-specific integrase [Methanorbis rubei]|uniref:Tyrosine recombinase XerC n=1 Tax=Methanorbis rubei TaxID=3028300 RepID=A0AAE4MH63_9EURY|nr:Tyrosine recombinase XerC [Methanocorpusculaceae archaeon Cs1]